MLLEHSELTAHSNEIPQEQPTPENCFLLIPGIGKGGENDTQEGMDIHAAEYTKPCWKTCIHSQLCNSVKLAARSFNKKLSHVRTKDLLLTLQLSQLS